MSPGGTLWELCGGAPALGSQSKILYRSIDEGGHWTAVVPRSGQANALDGGYLGTLVVGANSVLALTQVAAPVAISRDGGRSWHAAFRTPTGYLGGEGGSGWATFSDGRHGFIGLLDQVFRTGDDGDTWMSARLPF
jgi:hypothetical protein